MNSNLRYVSGVVNYQIKSHLNQNTYFVKITKFNISYIRERESEREKTFSIL